MRDKTDFYNADNKNLKNFSDFCANSYFFLFNLNTRVPDDEQIWFSTNFCTAIGNLLDSATENDRCRQFQIKKTKKL